MNLPKNSTNKKELSTENLRLGIDIGSSFLRAAVTTHDGLLLDAYEEPSAGVSCGVIVEPDLFKDSLQKLSKKVTKNYKKIPGQTIVGLGGIGQRSGTTTVNTFVSRADGMITFLDIEKLTDLAKEKCDNAKNKTVLHAIPIKNWIDGVEVVGSPEGLRGSKIESKILIISDDSKQEQIVNEVFDSIGLDIDMLVSAPLADAYVSLSKREKRIGSASINLGADTTSICVYENSVPLLISIIKAGGEQITSDIALGLRVPVDIAEEIKHGNNDTEYSKRRYEEIVEARVSDMAMKITDELARIMRAELLPAGVVLLGGTSLLNKIEHYFRFDLRLPIGNALRNLRASERFYIDDIKYARVYGLTFFAESISEGGLYMSLLKRGFAKTSNFIKRFLP